MTHVKLPLSWSNSIHKNELYVDYYLTGTQIKSIMQEF